MNANKLPIGGGRNYGLDLLKILACICVVLIHVNTPLTAYYFPILRFAVPEFFLISGYLFYKDNTELRVTRRKKYLKYYVSLTIISATLYLFVRLPHRDFSSLVTIFLFNEPSWAIHLWYLFAYCYVLLAIGIIEKLNLRKVVVYTIPLLLVVDLMMGSYAKLFFSISFPNYVTRNWLFEGLPYFIIGCMFKKRIPIISSLNLVFMLIVGIALSYIEHFSLIQSGNYTERCNYMGTIIVTISAFLLAHRLPVHNEHIRILSEGYIFPVYILHPLVAFTILENSYICLSPGFFYLRPIYVIIVALLITKIYKISKQYG